MGRQTYVPHLTNTELTYRYVLSKTRYTDWTIEESWFNSRRRQEVFSSPNFKIAMGPIPLLAVG